MLQVCRTRGDFTARVAPDGYSDYTLDPLDVEAFSSPASSRPATPGSAIRIRRFGRSRGATRLWRWVPEMALTAPAQET